LTLKFYFISKSIEGERKKLAKLQMFFNSIFGVLGLDGSNREIWLMAIIICELTTTHNENAEGIRKQEKKAKRELKIY
jgi:hypothetical protein